MDEIIKKKENFEITVKKDLLKLGSAALDSLYKICL